LYKNCNRADESRKLFLLCKNEPLFAPFYAARASLLSGINDEQVLADLQKSVSLDKNEWRYTKLLAEYYIDHKENAKALALIEPFYKAHSGNYIMGLLYAKTLLLNKKYGDCSVLLSGINILPFEGATVGRELYHETKLMQAADAIKNKNYTRAISFINDAKKWPENLGVGKPYPEDIDERLENWMSYLCYEKTGKSGQAKQFLQNILDFTPKIENTVANFIPANDLVTAWAMAKVENRTAAINWLNKQVNKYPGNKIILWCLQAFENPSEEIIHVENPGVTLVQQVSNLQK
jgi:tetratricopeptide (TPR) repeat protein